MHRADEIPEPGDFFTTQILNEPLLVVRGTEGQIRVLANICAHRGKPLAEGSGNTARFICSYHDWTYGLDGASVRASRLKHGDSDVKNCQFHSHNRMECYGFLFVSLDPRATFDLPELDALLVPNEPRTYRLSHVAEKTWAFNWKCLVENFMEGFHLSIVHPETLHGYTPSGLAEKGPNGPGWTS